MFLRRDYVWFILRLLVVGIFAFSAFEGVADTQKYYVNDDTVVSLESVCESDLNSTDINWGVDANANNHNIFVINDKVYQYVYTLNREHQLRVIDLKNGFSSEMVSPDLGNIEWEHADEFKSQKYITFSALNDDAGNICLVAIYSYRGSIFDLKSDPKTPPILKISVCAFKDIESKSHNFKASYYEEKASELDTYVNQFITPLEINSIKGDAYSGNFKLVINGLHHYVNRRTSDQNNYCVGEVTFGFENFKKKSSDYVFFKSEDLGDFDNYSANENKANMFHFFNIFPVDEKKYLLQRHKKTAPILFTHNGKGNYLSDLGTFPLLEQEDILTEFSPEVDKVDSSKVLDARYGAYPFTIGEETFLLTVRRTYSENGPKFVLFHWDGDKTSFNGSNRFVSFQRMESITFRRKSMTIRV